MNEERNNMEEWLQIYSVPPVSEKRIENLIFIGKDYINSSDFNKNSLWNMLLNQLTAFKFQQRCFSQMSYRIMRV